MTIDELQSVGFHMPELNKFQNAAAAGLCSPREFI
jgi:hypothetical protein